MKSEGLIAKPEDEEEDPVEMGESNWEGGPSSSSKLKVSELAEEGRWRS